jgi:hypothetical protein
MHFFWWFLGPESLSGLFDGSEQLSTLELPPNGWPGATAVSQTLGIPERILQPAFRRGIVLRFFLTLSSTIAAATFCCDSPESRCYWRFAPKCPYEISNSFQNTRSAGSWDGRVRLIVETEPGLEDGRLQPHRPNYEFSNPTPQE